MQKAWQKTFEIILKTIKILRKKINSDGEMKTTAFTVTYSHVIQPTHFTYVMFFSRNGKMSSLGKTNSRNGEMHNEIFWHKNLWCSCKLLFS